MAVHSTCSVCTSAGFVIVETKEFCNMNSFTVKKTNISVVKRTSNNGFFYIFVLASHELDDKSIKIIKFTVSQRSYNSAQEPLNQGHQ